MNGPAALCKALPLCLRARPVMRAASFWLLCRLVSKRKPKRVMVCMIYFPDEKKTGESSSPREAVGWVASKPRIVFMRATVMPP